MNSGSGRILTDPELEKNEPGDREQLNIVKKNLKIKFLEKENDDLNNRVGDLETSLGINKQIIAALLDAS